MPDASSNPKREALLNQVFAARTLAEVAAAQQALRDWLDQHPGDAGLVDAFEILSHQEERERAREPRCETLSTPASVT